MDVSKIVELVNALGDTWISQPINMISIGLGLWGIGTFFRSMFQFGDCIISTNLFRNIEKYIEFSMLRDFPEYVKSEKSAKWLDKVRLWFIRNS